MLFSQKFISFSRKTCTLNDWVAAPYMRRDFVLSERPEKAELTVCALGFYELFVNGKKITKGHLSPYIVNPDQILPYDTYDVSSLLKVGKNVIAFILGNGMQNAFGGFIWNFDKTSFLSAPKLAFALELIKGSEKTVIEADESVLCHPSPIIFDDLRYGEKYDANQEVANWNLVGCDLSDWTPPIHRSTNAGEPVLCDNHPIVATGELRAVSITPVDGGYLYDFGVNIVGLTRLCVKGAAGQHIVIDHSELIEDGKISFKTIMFDRPHLAHLNPYVQRTEYTCRGEGVEEYTPHFTYYGFRYAYVTGIESHQATADLLTCVIMNTKLGDRGNFSCSDETLNKLQGMTRRSTLGNFQHFPNDCPHREKNGWTADAALSAEQTLLNFEPEDNYLMWEKCIVRAMNEQGALPGIVPTGGWGFHWGNGPAWDSVLIYLPYFCAVLRDDLRVAEVAKEAMVRYLRYLTTRRDIRGLLEIGLGDWCPANPDYTAPLIFTDSTIAYDLARKAAYLYDRMEMRDEADYCRNFAVEMRAAIRKHLLEDAETMRFMSGHQTLQSMAIFYGLCDSEEEKEKALAVLLDEIHGQDDHMGVGVLGGRVIFRVLCDNGYEDLAIKMITRPDPPSYGVMIADGLTTLAENVREPYGSLNHHFWGDISALFIEYFAGIRPNPDLQNAQNIDIRPLFPTTLQHAKAYYKATSGRVDVSWERKEENIILRLTYPRGAQGVVVAPRGYFVNGEKQAKAHSGTFIFSKQNKLAAHQQIRVALSPIKRELGKLYRATVESEYFPRSRKSGKNQK